MTDRELLEMAAKAVAAGVLLAALFFGTAWAGIEIAQRICS